MLAKTPLVLHGWFAQRATPAAARGVTAFSVGGAGAIAARDECALRAGPDSGFFEEVLLAFLEPAAVALLGGGAPDEAAQTPGRGHQTNTASGSKKRGHVNLSQERAAGQRQAAMQTRREVGRVISS